MLPERLLGAACSGLALVLQEIAQRIGQVLKLPREQRRRDELVALREREGHAWALADRLEFLDYRPRVGDLRLPSEYAGLLLVSLREQLAVDDDAAGAKPPNEGYKASDHGQLQAFVGVLAQRDSGPSAWPIIAERVSPRPDPTVDLPASLVTAAASGMRLHLWEIWSALATAGSVQHHSSGILELLRREERAYALDRILKSWSLPSTPRALRVPLVSSGTLLTAMTLQLNVERELGGLDVSDDGYQTKQLEDFVNGLHQGGPGTGRRALTRREQEVLPHLLRETSYEGIACALHISVSTVKTHAQNIRIKQGVTRNKDLST